MSIVSCVLLSYNWCAPREIIPFVQFRYHSAAIISHYANTALACFTFTRLCETSYHDELTLFSSGSVVINADILLSICLNNLLSYCTFIIIFMTYSWNFLLSLFFRYACGRWSQEHPIPDSSLTNSWFSERSDRMARKIRDLLKVNMSASEVPWAVMQAKALFTSCMDVRTLPFLFN